MPSHTGGLWIVGAHVPVGLRRSSAGGHWPERCVFAEQRATVEDVEYSSQPPYRHHQPGRDMLGHNDPLLLERGLRVSVLRLSVAAARPKINPKSEIHPGTIAVK